LVTLANHNVTHVQRNKKILWKRKKKDTCDIVVGQEVYVNDARVKIYFAFVICVAKLSYWISLNIWMSSDILTTILIQPLKQLCCSLFSLVKNNRERKMKR